MPKKNNIVFIRSMRFLGGHLVTYPLLHQIRQQFPNDMLTVVGTDPVGSHYVTTPWVNRFIQANTAWSKFKACSRADRVFVLHYSSEQYAPISYAQKVPVRVGFRNRRISDWLWSHSYPKKPDEYLGLANLNLLQCLGNFDPHAAARQAMQALSSADEKLAPSDVVFMPGGGAGAYKRWRIESYLNLADQLKRYMGPNTTFSLVMGPDEIAEERKVRALGRFDLRVVQGRSMSAVAGLALNARLVVANDCGPSHIAQSVCKPYVGVFHAPNPQWFWRRHNSVAVVPNNGTQDIQSISVERVLQAAKQVLASA